MGLSAGMSGVAANAPPRAEAGQADSEEQAAALDLSIELAASVLHQRYARAMVLAVVGNDSFWTPEYVGLRLVHNDAVPSRSNANHCIRDFGVREPNARTGLFFMRCSACVTTRHDIRLLV
jgi:hypothetical protein